MLKHCYFHNLPITSICTYNLCDCLFLCDICLNDHDREHNYIITLDSIKKNIFENLITRNTDEAKRLKHIIRDSAKDYITKIEYNFEVYVTNFMDVIEKCKKALIDKVEVYKKSKLEELDLWEGIKPQYQKAYKEFIHHDVFNVTFDDDSKALEQSVHFGDNPLDQSLFDRNVYMNNMLNLINTIMENQLYHFNTQRGIVDDYVKSMRTYITEGLGELKTDFKDMLERLNFDERDVGGLQQLVKPSRRSSRYANTTKVERLSLSPFKLQHQQSHSCLSFLDFNNLSISTVDVVVGDKKGAWYSLEYIDELDYVVCGYQSGEIVIFKESDSTLIRTYRPRTKRIRKLIYSQANASIFASYDDGYIVVISLSDLNKVQSFKMSEAQIYTMEILPNQNILAYGGVEKKIFYAPIIDLKQISVLYDSEHGEVQSILYDEKTDILIAGLRKSHIVFIKFRSGEIIYKHEFKGTDCCAMNIKKYTDDTFILCGYYMNIHMFKVVDNKIEHLGLTELKVSHVYDVFKLDDHFVLATTFDDDKIILYDMRNKCVTRIYEKFRGALQLSLIKSQFYLTSHSESLKKLIFK
jgi:WD40 repeat protein